MQTLLIIIGTSLLLSAFFSGMEIAFISCNRLYFEIEKSKGKRSAALISKFTQDSGKFISTMLIGNNIALVIYGLMMAQLCDPWVATFIDQKGLQLLLTTLISTVVVLVTAEFVPKALFSKYANSLLLALGIPAYVFYVLLSPLVWFFGKITNMILKLTGQKKEEGDFTLSRKDLLHLLQEHQDENAYDPEDFDPEIQILQNALDFSRVKVRECMTPRTEVVAINITESVADIRSLFVSSGYSKIPIYRDSVDQIIGYTHSFELFKSPETIEEMLIPAMVVPESMLAHDMLQLFGGGKRGMAVVIDEYGGTSGIVCLEDIIEEIFGEIEDEHDTKDDEALLIEEGKYHCSARIEIDQLNAQFSWELPELEEYETLGGMISFHLGKIATKGDVLALDNVWVEVLESEANRITVVEVREKEYFPSQDGNAEE